MKISDLLCQYLYQNKELVLEGFGVFNLDQSVNPLDNKEPQQIYQGITFENNAKIKTPTPLVDFLIQQSGKMRPLAISDLEAFLTTGRELLNLGKPLVLTGIGTLTGYKANQLDFTPGPFIPVKLDSTEGQFRDRVTTNQEEMFRTEDGHSGHQQSMQNRKWLLLLAAVLVLLLAGWGVYHFAFHKKEGLSAEDSTSQIQPVDAGNPAARKDTSAAGLVKTDTTSAPAVNPGSTTPAASPAQLANSTVNGPVSFRVLIQTFNEAAKAQRRYDSLKNWGHNVVLETIDPTHLSIVMPFSLPLADTTQVKDSLSTFFGRPVHVLLGQ